MGNPLSRWLGRGALGNRGSSEYWDQIARQRADRHYRYESVAKHVSSITLGLLARWGDAKNSKRIMKTDLFEEAFRSRQLMFDVARVNSNVVGIDVSREITYRAKTRSRQYGADLGDYVCCDVRQLPFSTDSIDLVISTSTLDHFSEEEDILVALRELSRVLRPGGTLTLTMDNKSNLTYPLIRLWMALGLTSFFIGKTYSISELKSRLKSSGFAEVAGERVRFINIRIHSTSKSWAAAPQLAYRRFGMPQDGSSSQSFPGVPLEPHR